jgi:UDPglucose--hexose-1-phosphate uridylyltransferase
MPFPQKNVPPEPVNYTTGESREPAWQEVQRKMAMPINFLSQELEVRVPSVDRSQTNLRRIQVRSDPLLGTTSRIVDGVKLQTADCAVLENLQREESSCPFCLSRIDHLTPAIDSRISAEPRIRLGESTVFPNLVPYSQYAAVAVLTSKHWLNLCDFSPALIRDNLLACIQYVRAVHAFDPRARYCAWNINYLYPSGGSLPHPHSQVFLDPFPTTMLRFQLDASEQYRQQSGTSYWEDLVSVERERNQRFVGEIGTTAWMTAFAPLGFNEVRAVIRGRETFLQLDQGDVTAVATGISRVLRWYDRLGYNSFNLSLFSGPLDGAAAFRMNLVMVTRTALIPFYRSDSMHLERLHWEAAVDRTPETLALELRTHFI